MNNLIISEKPIGKFETVTNEQFANLTIKELKEYETIIIIDSEKTINKKYLEQFIKASQQQDADYKLLFSDAQQICYAVSINTKILTKKIMQSVSKTIKNEDLNRFCCELKGQGYYGEASLLDEDILHTLLQDINAETGETLTKAEKYLKNFCNQYENIYIYGAGKYGHQCLARTKNISTNIKGIIETRKTVEEIDEIPVYSFEDVAIGANDGIIIALKKDFCFQVLPLLVEKEILHYCIYPFWLS